MVLVHHVQTNLDRDAYFAKRSRMTKATTAALKPDASYESEEDSEVVEEVQQHQNKTKRV